ncbi:hypothetical protein [Streptomyces sp. NPDC054783]
MQGVGGGGGRAEEFGELRGDGVLESGTYGAGVRKAEERGG